MALTDFWKYVLILLTYLHLARKKYLQGNNMSFMNKNVVNAHRKRTHLRNKFLKNRAETNRVCNKKQ